MAKKRLTIVAGSMNTAKAIRDQLYEYIDDQQLSLFAIEEGINECVSDELVLLSSELTKQDLIDMDYYDSESETIVAMRTMSYDFIDQIVSIPKDTEVLLVNDLLETADAMIDNLRVIGLDHLNYVPYCPGMPEPSERIKVAITPGESDKVPSSIEMIYDIGPRLLDFSTVTKVLMALDTLGEKAGRYSQAYLQKIIMIAKRLASSRQEIEGLNQQLNRVIDGLKEGLMVYNHQGIIRVINGYACQLLGVRQHLAIGKTLKTAIGNIDFLEYLYQDEMEGVRVLHIDGHAVSMSKMKSPNGDVIVSLKRPDVLLEEHRAMQQELARKGYTAKYNFDHIVGESVEINKAKRICAKLAKSDLTILLHGESGTGKELFASAIHRASIRSNGPFLAINFSALPDELIESELFGYEDGAFTGAKKGGKAGLFEQADGGTIFLDELGDVSPKVQARLLRVLQEGEVMRIGAQEIKRIDVRVVAATNKDLGDLVKVGKFREDLFYRLQMGYVYLPPLRMRRGDVPLLINELVKADSLKTMCVQEDALERLMAHHWPGNVRELKNCLRYMCAVADGSCLTVLDLPDHLQGQGNGRGHVHVHGRIESVSASRSEVDRAHEHLTEDELFVLNAIKSFERQKEPCGREKLAACSMGTPYAMTKYQMRTKLESLERSGYISLGRGKVGAKLTQKAADIIGAI